MFNIYKIFFNLLHISYAFLSIVKQSWDYLSNIYYGLIKNCETDAEYLLKSVQRIGKNRLPNHLVFNLGRESPSFIDIVRIIGWSATAGIPCVSFYDYDGILRKCESKVRRKLAETKPELLDDVDWSPGCPVKAVRNGTTVTKRKMRVQLISYSDGKREVALLAQSLGKGVITGALKADEVTLELLENKLELGGLPDPDVAIICGNTCSTYGLLPWHIKITEFLMLNSHHNLKLREFVRLLEKYAKCEQRYGK